MASFEPRQNRLAGLRTRGGGFRAFGPVIGPIPLREVLAGAAGSGLALLLLAALIQGAGLDPATGVLLVAPIGASSIILFALPNSPLAQPWSAVVGNTLCATTALAVHWVTQDTVLAAGASVCLAVGAMFLFRALHPPGGAIALTGALNPELLDALGVRFVLVPVFLGTLSLVALAMLWHGINGRVYPFRQPLERGPHATSDKAPQQRLGLSPEDLGRILVDFRQSANLGVEDLARLVAAAEQLAAAHTLDATRCGDIMSRDLVTVAPQDSIARVAALFRKHGFTSIPVVEDRNVLLGVIFQLDLIRAPRAAGLRAALGLLPTRKRDDVLPRVRELMTVDLPAVAPDTPASELLPLLADGGPEAIPVLEEDRIVGIVTRTDLLSALARTAARS